MARPARGAYPLLAPAAASVLARLALWAAQPDRLRLLSVLLGRERSVSDLAAALGLSPSKTSMHVSVLGSQGVVRYRQRGQHHLYTLGSGLVAEALALLVAEPEVALTGDARGATRTPAPRRQRG